MSRVPRHAAVASGVMPRPKSRLPNLPANTVQPGHPKRGDVVGKHIKSSVRGDRAPVRDELIERLEESGRQKTAGRTVPRPEAVRVVPRKEPASANPRHLYDRGRRYADRLAQLVGDRLTRAAAVYRLAAEVRRQESDVSDALAFAAVDHITACAGPEARTALLSRGSRLAPKVVMQIAHTRPDRQRFALAQIRAGRSPFGRWNATNADSRADRHVRSPACTRRRIGHAGAEGGDR